MEFSHLDLGLQSCWKGAWMRSFGSNIGINLSTAHKTLICIFRTRQTRQYKILQLCAYSWSVKGDKLFIVFMKNKRIENTFSFKALFFPFSFKIGKKIELKVSEVSLFLIFFCGTFLKFCLVFKVCLVLRMHMPNKQSVLCVTVCTFFRIKWYSNMYFSFHLDWRFQLN